MAKVTGGNRLKEKIAELLGATKKASILKVGFLENATYPDGTSVPLVAAINEFGAPSRGQPPRPFFRRMVSQKSGEWPKAISDLWRANKYDTKLTLDQAGIAIAGQLQQSIRDLVEPPLKPSTIARKGFSKPLIETSHMINSVTHEVQ